MIKIKISPILVKQIKKTFKNKSKSIFKWMTKLKENSNVGDFLAHFGGIELRELKYDNVFRFYFFSNERAIKILDRNELEYILIKIIAMSKKGKEQQKMIDKLKKELKDKGFDFF